MKRINYKCLSKIVDGLQKYISISRISNISTINSRDLIITFSSNRDEKLLISLNHQNPFISMVQTKESFPTLIGQANDILRKEIKDALLTSIKLINEDRIVEMSFTKCDEYFEYKSKFLILELIPNRPNLILLDENRKVIFAFHYTSINSSNIVVKNLTYQPIKKVLKFDSEADFNIDEIKKEAELYLLESKQQRSKEKFLPLYKHLQVKIKSLNKKEKILKQEIIFAKENLKYLEIGNMVLSLQNDKEELHNFLKENNLNFNEELSIGDNANIYFKKYKKAKRTIQMDELELQKSDAKIQYFTFLLSSMKFMSEDDLLDLSKEILPNKISKKENKNTQFISYIELNNTKIYFGKNAKQNDYLTSKFAKPNYTFVHIKDYHGSHIIINNENPTNDVLLLACEIALILSSKTVGSLYIAKVKDVKKGDSLGMVNLLHYKEITINNVREDTIKRLNNFKVIDF